MIIGHGLAGVILSQCLIEAGKSVLVLNDPSLNTASLAAGGLYNPITGRKLVKTWKADEIFPVIEPFYRELEGKLNARFLHPIGIYRPFVSIEEQNDWQGKAASPYIDKMYGSRREQYQLHDNFGGMQLRMAGFVDTKSLIEANKKYLEDKRVYRELIFDENQLISSVSGLEYAVIRFKKLIYCNGYNLSDSRYFGWLPFRPVKGEILDVDLSHEIDTVLNRGVFILPMKDRVCRVGATYNWREINQEVSQAGKLELEEKLTNLYRGAYVSLGAAAGIRPATKDRRPFLGLHPKDDRMAIFNGFGSKGVSLIPYFARQMVEFLEGKTVLDREVSISRYLSLC